MPIIPNLISKEQGCFVPGRETAEGALVAHEVLDSIKKNAIQSVIIKLDMMKAYDRVDWSFLLQVLLKFGFHLKLCKWIMSCLKGAKFLVLINGSPAGFFSSSQGVRQGDPLSPFLFIILAKALSRFVHKVHSQGN